MKKFILSFSLLLAGLSALACTSIIISGNRTESGLPLMLKNRDTDCLDNRLQWFQVDSFRFIGLVNAVPTLSFCDMMKDTIPVDSGEVWAGQNNYGFAIMNTAVYNFDEDSVTAEYKMQLLALQKDSIFMAAKIDSIYADSLLTRKMKNAVVADTLRRKYAVEMDTLRPILRKIEADMDSVNELLAIWTDSITRHPEILPEIPVKDQEGLLMYRALASCKNVKEFLAMVDSLPRPWGVQANFGMIDTVGGAMYVEMNNWRYVTYDVNEEGLGYRVQTNFAFAGNAEEYKGWERYLTASAIMHDINETFTHQPMAIGHQWLFRHVCRSYRHEVLGYPEGYVPKNGIAVDQDFIPRRSTSAAVCFEGEAMWSMLGYPACAIAVPALVCDTDRLPMAVKHGENDSTCLMSNLSLQVKKDYVFPDPISNGKHYVHIGTITYGMKKKPSMLLCADKAEKVINSRYKKLSTQWHEGKISDESFFSQYEQLMNYLLPMVYTRYYKKYLPTPEPEVAAAEQTTEEQPAEQTEVQTTEEQPTEQPVSDVTTSEQAK